MKDGIDLLERVRLVAIGGALLLITALAIALSSDMGMDKSIDDVSSEPDRMAVESGLVVGIDGFTVPDIAPSCISCVRQSSDVRVGPLGTIEVLGGGGPCYYVAFWP